MEVVDNPQALDHKVFLRLFVQKIVVKIVEVIVQIF